MNRYKAKLDCEAQIVYLVTSMGKTISCRRFGKAKGIGLISPINLKKLVNKGCPLFFCCVQELDKKEETSLQNVSVVNEFVNVFPDEVSGMLPRREVEFTINLVHGTAPIS